MAKSWFRPVYLNGLRHDQHVALGKRRLRDLHYTKMNKVFDMRDVMDFRRDLTGAGLKIVSGIIK